MPDAVKGEEVKILVDDGAATMLEVEHQQDANFKTGKEQKKVRTKTGTLTWQANEGEEITFSFRKIRPLGAGQARLYALHASNEATQVDYDDSASGGHKRSGQARVTITDEASGVDDIVEANVTIVYEGDATLTVNV
jgi:hypothetical protein